MNRLTIWIVVILSAVLHLYVYNRYSGSASSPQISCENRPTEINDDLTAAITKLTEKNAELVAELTELKAQSFGSSDITSRANSSNSQINVKENVDAYSALDEAKHIAAYINAFDHETFDYTYDIEQKFLAEPNGDDAALALQQAIYTLISNEAFLNGVSLVDIECRTVRCQIIFDKKSIADQTTFIEDFSAFLANEGPSQGIHQTGVLASPKNEEGLLNLYIAMNGRKLLDK